MGNNLNPDGTKIKALRIQRGWTQEQLAEIAGISTRTVQRAERANTAAFETLRAIAVAFEMDFDQLLRPEVCDLPNTESRATQPSLEPGYAEPIPAGRPEPPARRAWPMYAIAALALLAGLIAGVNLSFHNNKPSEPDPAISSNAAGSPQIQARFGQAVVPQDSALARNTASDLAVQTSKSTRKTGVRRAVTKSAGKTGPVPSAATDPAVQSVLSWTHQPEDPDLMSKPRDIFSTHAIPEIPPSSVEPSVAAGADAVEEQDTGAVRQALGQAAKKTGSFVSRVGTSLKRVF